MTPADPTTPAVDPTAMNGVPAATPDLTAEPTFEECIEEWNRYDDDVKAGRLNGVVIPAGHYFAYYGGRIIDHDPDFIALQHRAAAAARIHWARLVIRYCQPWL